MREVVELDARAGAVDGVSALNDEARIALTSDTGARHLQLWEGETLVGYAQLPVRGGAVLVVDPAHRGRGLGTKLVRSVLDIDPDATFWSFHGLAPAAALAAKLGYVPARELLVMQRSLDDLPPAPDRPGVIIRGFDPAVDAAELLRVNAAAFAHHPEQGSLTLSDLQARMAEPWFAAADVLLAVDPADPATVLGFHWTKRHDATTGEVYVLGVAPQHAGRGLGTVLLRAGLHHLAELRLRRVILYVEGSEAGPVHLYTAHGFEIATRDVMYAASTSGTETEE